MLNFFRFIKLLMEFDVKNVKSPETQSIESLNGFHRNEKQSKKQKKLKEKGFFSHSVTSIINNVKKSFDSTVSTKKRNKSKSTKSNSSENPQGYYLQDSDVPTDSLEESNLPIIDNIPTKRNNLKAKILKNRKKHANKKHLVSKFKKFPIKYVFHFKKISCYDIKIFQSIFIHNT